jgi:hypothetical protein
VESVPGNRVYDPVRFRTEWGPIFHRGRLDGSARVLVLGQDPAAHETFTRRILCGEAGHRVQGFLHRLGVTRSYVMLNAYAYSVFGRKTPTLTKALLEDRYRWLDAILAGSPVEVVVTFGAPARKVWTGYVAARAIADPPAHAIAVHPTAPVPEAELLANWNAALDVAAAALVTPDQPGPLVHYGAKLEPGDLRPVPASDLPAGLPSWMAQADAFATRGEADDAAPTESRLTVTVPAADRPGRAAASPVGRADPTPRS